MNETYTTTITDLVPTEDLANIYDGARKLLLRDGWCRGEMMDSFGRRCTVGALEQALRSSIRWTTLVSLSPLRTSVYPYLCIVLGVSPPNTEARAAANRIANWNDTRGRAIDDVLGLLSRASAQIRSELLLARMSAADTPTPTPTPTPAPTPIPTPTPQQPPAEAQSAKLPEPILA